MTGVLIDRAFMRIDAGLIHYRTAAPADPRAIDGPPVYLAHSGPGSSRGLEDLIATLATHRRVIAPDLMGNGDSDPPPGRSVDLDFYVACAVDLLDRLGIDQVDFYGVHTGSHIGCELALAQPGRVRRLVLDGVALFSPDLRQEMIARYAPAIAPDAHGGHLAWAWHFVAGLFVHFPYYHEDPAHRLHGSTVPPPAVRQSLVVDLVKALPTYHLAYRAVFAHETAERLPGITQPTLLMAVDTDPLAVYLDAACALLPHAARRRVTRETRIAEISRFLSG
jgi:pimeloyl-ACP methyl ester carboxylesterase